MVEIGVAFVLVGAALLVAEAHVPAGILGGLGAVLLAGGAGLAIAGAGAGIALILAVTLTAAAAAGLFVAVAARKALAAGHLRTSSGREALSGDGQVLVDGALWKARRSWDDQQQLDEGDPVVVERVNGLTLCVRRAEDWEEIW